LKNNIFSINDVSAKVTNADLVSAKPRDVQCDGGGCMLCFTCDGIQAQDPAVEAFASPPAQTDAAPSHLS